MKLPVFLCTLTLAALWGPVLDKTPQPTAVIWCPFGMAFPSLCVPIGVGAPAPCPPPPKPIPLQPCHEPTKEQP